MKLPVEQANLPFGFGTYRVDVGRPGKVTGDGDS